MMTTKSELIRIVDTPVDTVWVPRTDTSIDDPPVWLYRCEGGVCSYREMSRFDGRIVGGVYHLHVIHFIKYYRRQETFIS